MLFASLSFSSFLLNGEPEPPPPALSLDLCSPTLPTVLPTTIQWGFPSSSDGKAMQEPQVQSLGQEYPLEKEMATLSRFLPAEFHGERSLVGYSPWGHKESDMTEQLTRTHTRTHTHTRFIRLLCTF